MTNQKEANPTPVKRSPYIFSSNQLPFILIHLSPIFIFWTGATWFDWAMCFGLYFLRMFFVTGVYHRYFSHRTYKTSRVLQFIFAFWAETSAQKGVLWWAAHHRDHHRHSDQPEDPHSMKLYGFWYSHLGWIMGPDYKTTNFGRIADFAKFKELRWLNTYYHIPPAVLGVAVTFIGAYANSPTGTYVLSEGLSTLVVGFLLSTVFLWHGTFSINSLMHKIGRQRYETGDESRNSLVLALVTLGEGWHNNHHYYMSATRQGFFWWEIDITYYILRTLQAVGLIWDMQGVPSHVKFARSTEEAKQLKERMEKENVDLKEARREQRRLARLARKEKREQKRREKEAVV